MSAAAMSAAADAAEPLVRVEDVHTFYGKSHILHGVSLEVGAGEVVGLLGRNGVGKSTTLKTIMGLVQPSHGTVLLDGNAITGLAPHKLARLGIGYVPEDRRIFRLLTVMENLRTGLDRHGVTDERRQALLDKVFTYFPVLAERRGQAEHRRRLHQPSSCDHSSLLLRSPAHDLFGDEAMAAPVSKYCLSA